MTERAARPATALVVRVGPELFRFLSLTQWTNKATSWFRRAGVTGSDVLCVDMLGRPCTLGKHFVRADRDGMFPVVAYRIDVD